MKKLICGLNVGVMAMAMMVAGCSSEPDMTQGSKTQKEYQEQSQSISKMAPGQAGSQQPGQPQSNPYGQSGYPGTQGKR